jgi:hypothetical protein
MNIKKTVLGLAGFALLTGGMVGAANARTSPAAGGRNRDNSNEACVTVNVSNGSVTNNCPGVINWIIPLQGDNGGAKTVTVGARSNFSTTGCLTRGFTRFGGPTMPSNTAVVGAQTGPLFVDLVMTGATLPNGGLIFVECRLDPGAQVTTAIYSP